MVWPLRTPKTNWMRLLKRQNGLLRSSTKRRTNKPNWKWPLTTQKGWLRSSTQNRKIRRKRQTSLQVLGSDGDKGMREDRLFLKPGSELHPLLLLQGTVHQEPDQCKLLGQSLRRKNQRQGPVDWNRLQFLALMKK